MRLKVEVALVEVASLAQSLPIGEADVALIPSNQPFAFKRPEGAVQADRSKADRIGAMGSS